MRVFATCLCFLGTAVLTHGGGVLAQDTQDDAGAADTAIIVDADLPEPRQVRGAARDLTRESGMIDPIIRYYDPLCVQVFGMTDRLAGYVRDRVIANALEAGIPVSEGECQANAIVMVGQEPRALYDALIDYNPRSIGRRSASRVRREISIGEPAVVWHRLEPRARDGIQVLPAGWQTFAIASRTRPSRLYAAVLGVVIMDADHLVGMDLERLSDYATMRLLAPRLVPNRYEIEEPRSVIYPFAPGEGETEMTRFDRAYLTALYSMQPQAPASALPAAVARAFEADE